MRNINYDEGKISGRLCRRRFGGWEKEEKKDEEKKGEEE